MQTSYAIKQVTLQNKTMISKKTFKQGQPIEAVIMQQQRLTHCNFCFLKKVLSQCSACHFKQYCSEQCQKTDWNIHKKQCKAIKKLINKNKKPFSSFLLVLRLYILCQFNKTIKKQIQEFLVLDKVYDHQKQQRFLSISVQILQCLSIQKLQSQLQFLIKLQKKHDINGFSIQSHIFDKQLALGIYYPVNFINHQCDPNAVQLFFSRTLTLVALRQIQPETQISISYTDRGNPQATRQKHLQNYYFRCFCCKCHAQNLLNQQYLCPQCDNVINKEQNFYCKQCKKQFTTAQSLKWQQTCQQLVNTILNNRKIDYSQKLRLTKTLAKRMVLQHSIFKPVLQQIYIDSLEQGFYKQAYLLIKIMFRSYQYWYSIQKNRWFQPAIMWRMVERARLAKHLNKPFHKILVWLQKSKKIGKIWLQGKVDCKQYIELQQMIKQIQMNLKMVKR